jgi:hypothetical protein
MESLLYRYTYCDGPTFQSYENFTTGKLFNICDDLSAAFGTEILPERVVEGGLVFKKFSQHRYKCIRFYTSSKWPWIDDKWIANAKQNPEIIIWKSPFRLGTALKALYGADPWTLNELQIIANCFHKYGLQMIENSMPTETHLIREYNI